MTLAAPARPEDPVRTIMTWPVATVGGDAVMRQVAEAMAADNVGLLPVVEYHSIVGVVSERDLARHLADRADPDQVRADEMMSVDIVQAAPNDRVIEVARVMLEAEVRHLPIADGGTIVGMVSARDLLAVLAAAVDVDQATTPRT